MAYKNSVKPKRDAWRTIQAIQNKEEIKGTHDKLKLIQFYKDKIETELKNTCHDVLDLLENQCISNAHNPESLVFFYKMQGDYFRYLGEFMHGDDRKKVIDNA